VPSGHEFEKGEKMNPLRQGYRLIALVLCVSFLFTNTACDNSALKERISDFQESVGLVSTSVGSYFAEMNQFERELYLQDVYLHPTRKVSSRGTKATATKPATSGLFGPFSDDSIRARMDAISLLGRYGKRLAELAGSNAPERFNSAAQELGTNLYGLQSTFNNLANGGDPTAHNFTGPIGAIIGAVGKMILEEKRDKKLRIAINEAAPAVRKVINLIENDLNTVVVPQRLSGNSIALSRLVIFYNCAVASGTMPAGQCPNPPPVLTLDQRRDFLNRIGEATRRYELFKTSNPAEAISTMRDAHEALVKYAENRSPQNLAALIAALDSFRGSAQQVADAVVQIRNLRRGES
jgi:hypothetical protein